MGRKDELTQFRQLLADTAGRAILITGQQGMGKSTLARRLLEEAARPPLICGSVTYEVTATDPPEAIMERMVEEGWAASQVAGSFSADPHRRRQWKAIFQTLPTGTKLLTLIAALRRPSKRSAREQLTHALARLSDGLPEHHRVLFFIDSEKRMSEGSEDPWCLLVRQLPPKILLLFAQRPDDALASSAAFSRLPNVARLPETELSPFTPDEIDDLLRPWASGLPYTRDQLRAHFARLEGHPYTAAAALDLLLDEEVQLDQLPTDRDGIAAEQRRRILRRGADASRLFSAHAVLEVPVPDDLVREVAQLDSHAHDTLLADPYVHGLLLTPEAHESTKTPGRRRIYHRILVDAIRAALPQDELQTLHRQAIAAYRQRLETGEPSDPLPALRLPEHVLAAEGAEAFAESVASGTARHLRQLGLWEEAEGLLVRAMAIVREETPLGIFFLNECGWIRKTRGDLDGAEGFFNAALRASEDSDDPAGAADSLENLGLLFRIRDELDRAERALLQSLAIVETQGSPSAMASRYGNLGSVYLTRGHLERAAEMNHRSLELHQQLGDLSAVARDYGNLAVVHRRKDDLDGAESYVRRSLEIHQHLGHVEEMAINYKNLGAILAMRGALDAAEEAVHRAMTINTNLGRPAGLAACHQNLGAIAAQRNEIETARAHWLNSIALYEQLGAQQMVAELTQLLESIGDSDS